MQSLSRLTPECPSEGSKLDIERGLVRMHVHGKEHLKQVLVLLPIHKRFKINSAAVCVEMDLLADVRSADAPLHIKRRAHRSKLRPLHALNSQGIPAFFGIEDVDIPVVIVDGLILKHPHEVAPLPGLENLAAVLLVVQA